MNQSRNRTQAERQVAETDQDIKTDNQHSDQNREDSGSLDVVCHGRTHLLGALQTICYRTILHISTEFTSLRTHVTAQEHLFRNAFWQIRLDTLVNHGLDLVIDCVGILQDSIVRGNSHLIALSDSDDVHIVKHISQRGCHLRRVNRLFETNDIVTTSREVDTCLQTRSEQ